MNLVEGGSVKGLVVGLAMGVVIGSATTGLSAPKYASAFPGMRIEPSGGETKLIGQIQDQAELRGILDAVAVYSLKLVSVSLDDKPVPGEKGGVPTR
jgi:hypothetical protein